MTDSACSVCGHDRHWHYSRVDGQGIWIKCARPMGRFLFWVRRCSCLDVGLAAR